MVYVGCGRTGWCDIHKRKWFRHEHVDVVQLNEVVV